MIRKGGITEGGYAVCTYSFESDMEGWNATGVDLDAPGGGGGSIPWSITRTQEIAKNGKTSLKLSIVNINDGGKTFIEKPFLAHITSTASASRSRRSNLAGGAGAAPSNHPPRFRRTYACSLDRTATDRAASKGLAERASLGGCQSRESRLCASL